MLTRIEAAYKTVTGQQTSRRTSPWLRSMRGEREELARKRAGISPIERVLVLSVIAAAIAAEYWFFFLAGSSLGSGD